MNEFDDELRNEDDGDDKALLLLSCWRSNLFAEVELIDVVDKLRNLAAGVEWSMKNKMNSASENKNVTSVASAMVTRQATIAGRRSFGELP